MRVRSAGLTLIELLIAIAIISIAFTAIAFSMLSNLRATALTERVSEQTTVAVRLLEEQMADILNVVPVTSGSDYDDRDGLSYMFIDYYYGCNAPTGRTAPREVLRDVQCTPNPDPFDVQSDEAGTLSASWTIGPPVGGIGPSNEGLIEVAVSVARPDGEPLRITNIVSCYDIYPSPKVDTPEPCPTPELP